jgi:hypothetical protein
MRLSGVSTRPPAAAVLSGGDTAQPTRMLTRELQA